MLVYIKLIIFIYLKEKVYVVEIKTSIIGGDFKILTMMFFNDRHFNNFGNRTNSKWYEVLQQWHITMYFWSGGLIVYGGHLKPEKVYWYPI